MKRGSISGFEMSVGLPVAQARPFSGLVRGRAGVHEMVDILTIAGYSGARLYRGQSSLFKIVAKQPPVVLPCVKSCVGNLRTRVSESFHHRSEVQGSSGTRGVQPYYSPINSERINIFRRYMIGETTRWTGNDRESSVSMSSRRISLTRL